MQQEALAHPQVRMHQDNVLVELVEPMEDRSSGGIILPATRSRNPEDLVPARVLATGPGHRLRDGRGPLVPVTVQPGELVLIGRLAGENYDLDPSAPRQNRKAEWEGDDHRRYRIVREDEIAGVLEE